MQGLADVPAEEFRVQQSSDLQSTWLSVQEENYWLEELENLPQLMFLCAGAWTIFGTVVDKVFHLISKDATRDILFQAKTRYLMTSFLHALIIVPSSIYWLATSSKDTKEFSFDRSSQQLKAVSSGFFLHCILFLASSFRSFSRVSLMMIFLGQSTALLCYAINRAFPASIANWLFFVLSLTQMPQGASSALYLMAKLGAPLYIQLRTALAMLMMNVAAVGLSLYAIYVTGSYIWSRRLWDVQGVDPRVAKFSFPFCTAAMACALAVGYSSWRFFMRSVDYVKERFIRPREQSVPVGPPGDEPGPRASSAFPKGAKVPKSARYRKDT